MKSFWLLIFSSFILFSCDKDDDNSNVGIYEKGVFVVNQGPFQNGTGTITHRNDIDYTLTQDVFGLKNNGSPLGNIAQAMIKFDGKYYISINNGAKIQVVNASDFTSVGEISNIALPRYFATNGTKLYVDAWGEDFQSGAVYQVNTTSQTLSEPIMVGGAPENMWINGNKLYVTISTVNTNSNELAIIDMTTNKLIKKVVVGDNPTSITSDKNGHIWVMCRGNTDYVNPDNSTPGSLVKLVDDAKNASFPLSNGADGLVINADNDRLFFLMDGKVMAHDINDSTFEKESIYDGYFLTIGYQKSRKRIYLADAKDYQSNGEALFISDGSSETGRFATGIIPGYFYFAE